MTYVTETLRQSVYDRANGRCEYCLIREDDVYLPHEVDHIIAEKHGGETVDTNLCLSCFYCNRHKGSDLASVDVDTGDITPLFHPRRDNWSEHFVLSGALIVPLTAKGRVTVRLLKINAPERVLEREILVLQGRYPALP